MFPESCFWKHGCLRLVPSSVRESCPVPRIDSVLWGEEFSSGHGDSTASWDRVQAAELSCAIKIDTSWPSLEGTGKAQVTVACLGEVAHADSS